MENNKEPNAETLQAIEDVNNGIGVETYSTVEELFKQLKEDFGITQDKNNIEFNEIEYEKLKKEYKDLHKKE